MNENISKSWRSLANGASDSPRRENRLISVTVSGQTTLFVYDGDGNLVKKIKPDGSKTLYVGGIHEVDKYSGGTVTRTVTYYPAGGAMRINVVGGSNTSYWVLKDHLSSASVLTNNTGAIVKNADVRYFPYGEARSDTTFMLTDKLFTGQREMRRPELIEGAGLGIYQYGARFRKAPPKRSGAGYSPSINRFLSAGTSCRSGLISILHLPASAKSPPICPAAHDSLLA